MFIHMVLFKIKKKNVPTYEKDCRMWHRAAAGQCGFLGYHTLHRTNPRGEYASFYLWKTEKDHRRFMDRHHDRLVALSRCPVEVTGYFNFKAGGTSLS